MRRRALRVLWTSVLVSSSVTIGLPPAHAIQATETRPSGHDIVRRAAAAFATGKQVYVDPGAAHTVSPATVEKMREKVNAASPTVFVAVLPARAKAVADDPHDLAQDLPEAVYEANRRDSGTYIVLCDDRSIYVGSDIIPTDRAIAIADAARTAGRADGPDAALLTATRRATREESPEVVKPYQVIAVVITLLLISGFGWRSLLTSLRHRRQKRLQVLTSVRGVADEDITRLEHELSAPDFAHDALDPEAQADFDRAVRCLQAAKTSLDMARQPEDLAGVSSSLEEARYALTCLRARLDGQPPPAWRPPCFFDPSHGPSTENVSWAPPDGEQRDVPACPTDAEHVRRGEPPDARHVDVMGELRPHWDASVNHVHWSRGYFASHAATVKGIWAGTLLELPDLQGAVSGGLGAIGMGSGGGGGFGGGGGRF